LKDSGNGARAMNKGILDDNMKENDRNLLEALKDHHFAHAKEWLDKGGNPNIRDKRGTPGFYYAIGDPPLMKLLISKGADVKLECDFFGGTVLHQAAFWGFLKTTRLVIEAGADLRQAANEGETPLHCAARMCTLESVNKGGVVFGQMDYAGTIGLLLEKGADVNARDGHDRTALHIICEISSFPDDYHYGVCIAKLLKVGAELNAEDALSYTPLDYVRNAELAGELIGFGAKFSANYKKHYIARSSRSGRATRPSAKELKEDVEESLREQEKERKIAEMEEELRRKG